MKKILSYAILPAILLVPLAVMAQGDLKEVSTFIDDLVKFINGTLIPLLLAVAFLVFIVGAVRFFLLSGDDNEEGKKKGKALMLYGIIAFVIIVSIWGIVALFADGLGLKDPTLENIPEGPKTRK